MSVQWNESEKKIVEDAVAAAEAKTKSEFVVAVVARSGTYESIRLRWALGVLGFGALTALVVESQTQFAFPLIYAFAGPWGFAAATYLLFDVPAVARRLIPRHRAQSEVHEKAKSLFLEHNLHATREHTGVLILLSALEHRLEILADRGFAEKVPPTFWQEHSDRAAQLVRAGKSPQAVLALLQSLSEKLAVLYPAGANDRNELDNRIRE